jgi:hypothetical protein
MLGKDILLETFHGNKVQPMSRNAPFQAKKPTRFWQRFSGSRMPLNSPLIPCLSLFQGSRSSLNAIFAHGTNTLIMDKTDNLKQCSDKG